MITGSLQIPPGERRSVSFAGALSEASVRSVVFDGVTYSARTTDLPALLEAVSDAILFEATTSDGAVVTGELSCERWLVRGPVTVLYVIAEVLSSAGCPAEGPDPDPPA